MPDRLLEVAAVDRVHGRDQEVAHGVAGEVPLVLGEPVLEQLRHRRLRLGERRQAVADVADGRDPQLLAQAAARAAVVGNRDDRRDVRRVLLETAQERGEPCPTPDRNDPGPAGQEAPPIDEVDEGLLGALGERAQERSHDSIRPVGEQEDAEAEEHAPPGPSTAGTGASRARSIAWAGPPTSTSR